MAVSWMVSVSKSSELKARAVVVLLAMLWLAEWYALALMSEPTPAAGMACLWSRRAAMAADPAAAESPWAWVDGAVASKMAMVAPDRMLSPVPSALAVPRVSAGAS